MSETVEFVLWETAEEGKGNERLDDRTLDLGKILTCYRSKILFRDRMESREMGRAGDKVRKR